MIRMESFKYLRGVALCWILLPGVLAVLVSCQKPREATIPILFQYVLGPDLAANKALIVFLPGNGDPVDRFGDPVILDLIERTGVAADVLAVDAHLGYYQNQTLVQRLKDDVIDPARAAGYKDIWIIGNSLGGLGALYYMKFHPQDIRGALLLGPFLGFEEIIQEIDRAGGVRNWNPGMIQPDDWEREFWRWVRDEVATDFSRNQVYLGFGNRDRLIWGQKLLAAVLPPGQVVQIEGGHDWKTWHRLLEEFLSGNKGLSDGAPAFPRRRF